MLFESGHDRLLSMREFYKHLRDQGLYTTPLLKTILRVLKSAKGPLSVNDIRFELAKRGYKPNKTSLYRQMTKLSEAEAVQESLFTDEIRRYCLLLGRKPHHHFVCQECGCAEHLPEEICNSFENQIASYLKEKGNAVDVQTIEFEGLCQKCVQK